MESPAAPATTPEETQHALRRLERLASLGTILAGAAHELNNPLAAIIGFAQLLRHRPLAPEDRAAVDTILREAERTARIVRDLLQAVRQRDGGERRAINLNDVVGYVAGTRRYTLETSDISCTLALDPSLPRVAADRAQLEQVVLNLVLNAEHALRDVAEGGAGRAMLRVSTRRAGHDVVLEVSDNGPGIADESVTRIWEPFYTTRPESGSGLGLSVVHGIVTAHGGSVAVTRGEGGGATFIVQLPAAPDRMDGMPSPSGTTRPLDVLVVDGDENSREFVAGWLTSRGHAVLTAASGADAAAMLDRFAFDAIIADSTTLSSTEEFLEAVRALPLSGSARIVLAAPGEATAGHRGAESLVLRLAKPYDLDQLRRFIEHS